MDYSLVLHGHTLEYIDEDHLYLVDGIIVTSITQLLKVKFGNKYDGINPATLQAAADKGTEVHEAIERYCKTGEESDLPEVRNFKFLRDKYGFTVLASEVPVILSDYYGNPVAAGRLDLVIEKDGEVGLADIKRTSALDKEYLAYQLNLYRIAYEHCYREDVRFLRGIHLRDDVRKYVQIPINEDMAMDLVYDYKAKEKSNE